MDFSSGFSGLLTPYARLKHVFTFRPSLHSHARSLSNAPVEELQLWNKRQIFKMNRHFAGFGLIKN
jgi:hypothetical protein